MKSFLIIILSVSIFSCSSPKKIEAIKTTNYTRASFTKGVCLGLCTQYNIYVEGDTIRYEGISNVSRYGIFERILTKEEKMSLDLSFVNNNFKSLLNQYPVDISDFPMRTITYFDGKILKKVEGRTELPAEFGNIQRDLESLTNKGEWRTIKEYPINMTNDVTNRNYIKGDIIENEIIIEPSQNISLGPWLRSQQKYSVNLVKKLSQEGNIWLISYDPNKISPKNMIEILKADPAIKSAEFNKVVELRNR